MYSFDAHYEQTSAIRAERAFVVRSFRELRPWSTFGPPVVLAVVVSAGTVFEAPAWFLLLFGVLLAGSVLTPLYFYVARPLAAGKLARQHPVRRVALSSEAISVDVQGRSVSVHWSRIEHIWLAEDHLILVLGRFAAISIPQSSLSAGSMEFICSSCKNVMGRPLGVNAPGRDG